jgi:hypothetical protein
MALRSPEVEWDILRDKAAFERFVARADQTIHCKHIPRLLQIEGHPWLRRALANKAKPEKFVVALSYILYRSDDVSVFQSHEVVRKRHLSAVAGRKKAAKPYVHMERLQLDFNSVMLYAATALFRELCIVGDVYSMVLSSSASAKQPSIHTLKSYLSSVAILKKGNNGVDSKGLQADVESEDIDLQLCGADEVVFFRVLHENPSKQKVQHRPAASGKDVFQHQFAVQLLKVSPSEFGDTVSVDISPGHIEDTSIAPLSYLGSDIAFLKHCLRKHDEIQDSMEYRISGQNFGDPQEVSGLLGNMLRIAAVPASPAVHMLRDQAELAILEDMEKKVSSCRPAGGINSLNQG